MRLTVRLTVRNSEKRIKLNFELLKMAGFERLQIKLSTEAFEKGPGKFARLCSPKRLEQIVATT